MRLDPTPAESSLSPTRDTEFTVTLSAATAADTATGSLPLPKHKMGVRPFERHIPWHAV